MKQTEWKIIYTRYQGVSKKAITLLSKEAGSYLIREPEVYRIHVLPCEKEGCSVSKNAFFVSLYNDSPLIQKYVKSNEIAEDGFLVKVIPNPTDEEGRFVLLTAHSEQALFYAVVSFLDDYIPTHPYAQGCNRMPELIFDYPLSECSYSQAPDHKTRSIFTWGHSINDYRAYIDNMARTKFNELILWNDYIPINIDEIIDYAHSYGIKVVLGYSWGWKEFRGKPANFTEENIKTVKELALSEYREKYLPINCDGIYFQSFTEREEQKVGDKLVSECVADMVNEIAEEIWQITPDLRLIFGLHATSVQKHLDHIARVNPRIEILWEDCGEFPYNYNSFVSSEEKYAETLEFTKKILQLRGGAGVGFVFKGVTMLDWQKFVYQRGPYVMGENGTRIANHDRRLRANIWKAYSADWIQNGDKAAEMIRFINKNKICDVTMCLAGTFDGGIYLPFALCGQMFWDGSQDYKETLKTVARRTCITTD